MASKKWFLVAVSALIVVLAFAIIGQNTEQVAESRPVDTADAAASELPEFQLQDSVSQQLFVRSDLLGEKMLLNVWATWCVACRQEHGFLHELAHKDIKIVGLNYRDRPVAVEKWFDELGNPYKVNLLDIQGKLGQQLPVLGAPETYLIDRHGVIHHKHVGIIDQIRWDLGLMQIYEAME